MFKLIVIVNNAINNTLIKVIFNVFKCRLFCSCVNTWIVIIRKLFCLINSSLVTYVSCSLVLWFFGSSEIEQSQLTK